MDQPILIGIDAGGTSTVAAAYTISGERIALVRGDACNISADPDGALRALTDTTRALLRQLAQLAPSAHLPLVCVGAAGAARNPKPLEIALVEALGARAKSICVMTDAELALYAAFGSDDGLLIICGTGSIGYRRHGGTLLRAGGWGHLLGDEGSGYDIAIRAIRAVLLAADTANPGPVCAIQHALLSQLSLSTPSELITYVYSHSKAEIAALAMAVVQCARSGDEFAMQLLQQAGESLGALTEMLLSRAPVTAPLPVALSGSILTHCSEVRLSFEQALASRALPISRTFCLDEPTRGVLALYAAQA